MFPDSAEDFLKDFHVFGEGFGVDRDIINVDMHRFSNQIMENVIHGSLECCRGIAQAKGHSVELVVTAGGGESTLGSGILGKTYLIEP
jgi:hypothetical protein